MCGSGRRKVPVDYRGLMLKAKGAVVIRYRSPYSAVSTLTLLFAMFGHTHYLFERMTGKFLEKSFPDHSVDLNCNKC